MRVLHVHSGNLYGGIESVLATLARYRSICPSIDHEFAVCFDGQIGEELLATGARLHHLSPVRVRYPLTVFRARRRLRDLIAQDRFDIVICHSSWSHAVFAPAVRGAGAKQVRWLHDAFDPSHWLDRWAGRVAPDLAIANSRFTADSWAEVYRNSDIRIILNPVRHMSLTADFDRKSMRQQFDTPKEAVVVLQLSRMEELKGQAVLLRALGSLRDDPSWVCWLAGGAQRPAEREYCLHLRKLAESLGIADRVRFLGHRRDAAEVLAAADIFCQPNLGPEGFGIVFIEALFSGLPIVTSAFGGATEIVNNECGMLVAPNEPQELAMALHSLIGCQSRRLQLGGAGPSRAASLCDPVSRMADLNGVLARVPKPRLSSGGAAL
jgi:glycosyltransferase involved in cell wall biosynthesis